MVCRCRSQTFCSSLLPQGQQCPPSSHTAMPITTVVHSSYPLFSRHKARTFNQEMLLTIKSSKTICNQTLKNCAAHCKCKQAGLENVSLNLLLFQGEYRSVKERMQELAETKSLCFLSDNLDLFAMSPHCTTLLQSSP